MARPGVPKKHTWVPKSGQDEYPQPQARTQAKRGPGLRAGAHESWKPSLASSSAAAGSSLSVSEVQQGLSSLLQQFHSKDTPAAQHVLFRSGHESTAPAKLKQEPLAATLLPGELLLKQLQGGAQSQQLQRQPQPQQWQQQPQPQQLQHPGHPQQPQEPQQHAARSVPAAGGKSSIARQIKRRIFQRSLLLQVRQLEMQERGPYHGPQWSVEPRPASDDAAEEDGVHTEQAATGPLLSDAMPVGLRMRMEAPVFQPGSAWVPATPDPSAFVQADSYAPGVLPYGTNATARQQYASSPAVYAYQAPSTMVGGTPSHCMSSPYSTQAYGMAGGIQPYSTQLPEVPTWPFGSQNAYSYTPSVHAGYTPPVQVGYNPSVQVSMMGTVPLQSSPPQVSNQRSPMPASNSTSPKLADVGRYDEDLESTTVSSGQLSSASQSPHH